MTSSKKSKEEEIIEVDNRGDKQKEEDTEHNTFKVCVWSLRQCIKRLDLVESS